MSLRTKLLVLLVGVSMLVTGLTPGVSASVPTRCRLAIATAAPVGITACPGVRPGALVEIPHSGDGDVFCTMGFVFLDPKGHWYISTAGHCVIGSGPAGTGIDGKKIWAPGTGPAALDSDRHKIGTYVFGVESTTQNIDFGLILLTRKPNPQMCHFGGPKGVNTSMAFPSLVQLHLYGNALGLGDVLPARSGYADGFLDKGFVNAILPSFEGDSGGPVIDGFGNAVGYVVAFGTPQNLAQPGTTWIFRLSPQVGIAMAALHTQLKLVTAKTL